MSEIVIFSAGKPLRFSRGNCFPHPKTVGSRSGTARFPCGVAPCRASVQTFPAGQAAIESGRRRTETSLYDVLRVKDTATLREIKTAYRSLAKIHHPDMVAKDSDGSDFIEIHNAYATLSDPRARAMYDLSQGVQRRQACSGFTGRPSRVYTTRRWETDQCW